MILKANTLLADHIFSPALFLAERIERNLPGKARLVRYGLKSHYAVCIFDQYSCILVLELGAGSALPSLLLSTRATPPSLVVVTDHPDEVILGNLRKNVKRNST